MNMEGHYHTKAQLPRRVSDYKDNTGSHNRPGFINTSNYSSVLFTDQKIRGSEITNTNADDFNSL
jgi:hypothetical protein